MFSADPQQFSAITIVGGVSISSWDNKTSSDYTTFSSARLEQLPAFISYSSYSDSGSVLTETRYDLSDRYPHYCESTTYADDGQKWSKCLG